MSNFPAWGKEMMINPGDKALRGQSKYDRMYN